MRPCLLFLVGCVALSGCSGDEESFEPASSRSPIEFGSPDAVHGAVVEVDSATRACSGSVVRVKPDGTAYVLTAAHCCTGTAADVPSLVFMGNDVSLPSAQRFRVNAGSVYYDAGFTGTASPFDFCMLTFAGAPASTPTLSLPPVSGDGLTLNAAVEHVGYGITAPPLDVTNERRFHGTDLIDMPAGAGAENFAQQFTYSAGGPGNTPGTCPGDSGGPSLFPAGAAPSAQVIVGVQSFGGPATASCGGYLFGGDSRVSSRIGPGKFITTYIADGSMTGIGIHASTPVPALPRGALGGLAAALTATAARFSGQRRRLARGAPV